MGFRKQLLLKIIPQTYVEMLLRLSFFKNKLFRIVFFFYRTCDQQLVICSLKKKILNMEGENFNAYDKTLETI